MTGEPLEKFHGTTLPTTCEVMRVYFHHHEDMKLSQKDAVILTVRQVCDIWSKARIPMAEERNIVRKIELLLEKHRCIYRNKN